MPESSGSRPRHKHPDARRDQTCDHRPPHKPSFELVLAPVGISRGVRRPSQQADGFSVVVHAGEEGGWSPEKKLKSESRRGRSTDSKASGSVMFVEKQSRELTVDHSINREGDWSDSRETQDLIDQRLTRMSPPRSPCPNSPSPVPILSIPHRP